MSTPLILSQVYSIIIKGGLVHNITDKPNYITPQNPFKEAKTDNLHDDVCDRAFRLDAMRRKIQSAGLQPR